MLECKFDVVSFKFLFVVILDFLWVLFALSFVVVFNMDIHGGLFSLGLS